MFGNWYIQDQHEQAIVAMCSKPDAAVLLTAAANVFVTRMKAGASSLAALVDKLKQEATEASGKKP